MSLHDRIMSMCAPDNVVSHPLCMGGYSVAQQRATEMAKEADEIMAEMAEALSKIAVEQEGTHAGLEADFVLTKYFMWKERTE